MKNNAKTVTTVATATKATHKNIKKLYTFLNESKNRRTTK